MDDLCFAPLQWSCWASCPIAICSNGVMGIIMWVVKQVVMHFSVNSFNFLSKTNVFISIYLCGRMHTYAQTCSRQTSMISDFILNYTYIITFEKIYKSYFKMMLTPVTLI